MSSTASQPTTGDPPAIVLDTHVVLDWLVFRNPVCTELKAHIESGTLRWIVSADIQGEFDHVLSRGIGASHSPDLDVVRAAWEQLAVVVEPAPNLGPAMRMRCTDEDDQKFIDLAIANHARWLLSRDRAVLKLARRALPMGLAILTPERWLASIKAAR